MFLWPAAWPLSFFFFLFGGYSLPHLKEKGIKDIKFLGQRRYDVREASRHRLPSPAEVTVLCVVSEILLLGHTAMYQYWKKAWRREQSCRQARVGQSTAGLFASISNGNAACLQPGVTVCQRGGALSCNGIQFPRVPGTDETKNCGATPRELNLCVSEYLLVSPGLQVLHIPITKFGKRASIFVFFAIQRDTPLLVVLCSLLLRK